MNNKNIQLGINVDHVATLREARKINIPDPVQVATLAEQAGCDSVVIHLRQDRRHIKDRDVIKLREIAKTRFNLEMSVLEEIVKIALEIVPDQITLVPEKRQELTTEGGLNVESNFQRIKEITDRCREKNIIVSLFIDPDKKQLDYSKKTGAKFVEFHTGTYVNTRTKEDKEKELQKLIDSCNQAHSLSLGVNAGHGLNYDNVTPITKLPFLEELNIGHSIIARSVFVGIKQAVKEMLNLLP